MPPSQRSVRDSSACQDCHHVLAAVTLFGRLGVEGVADVIARAGQDARALTSAARERGPLLDAAVGRKG